MKIAGLFGGGSPGYGELLLVLLVFLLMFGARKLPDLARSLGKSITEFKKGRSEGAKDIAAESPDDKPGDPEKKV